MYALWNQLCAQYSLSGVPVRHLNVPNRRMAKCGTSVAAALGPQGPLVVEGAPPHPPARALRDPGGSGAFSHPTRIINKGPVIKMAPQPSVSKATIVLMYFHGESAVLHLACLPFSAADMAQLALWQIRDIRD